MTPDQAISIIDAVGIILTVFVIVRVAPKTGIGKEFIPATLFLFAMVSLLFVSIYWFTYSLMRPGTRLPFAVNEIGEMAIFLLLSAMLETVFRDRKKPAKKEVAFTAVFVAASVALWIAWTGEWIQDILGGAAFGYFFCVCVRALKQTDALRRVEWLMLGGLLTANIAGETALFFLSGVTKKTVDLICYGIMFSVILFLLAKNILRAARGADARGNLALSCAAYIFSLSTMYMSEGWFYNAATVCNLITLPIMLIAVKREGIS